jgi:hypothetical protein
MKDIKVVCIKDDEWPTWAQFAYKEFPIKQVIYTVREIQAGVLGEEIIKDTTGKNPFNFKGKIVPVILLEELKNPIHPVSGLEFGFRLDRFAEVPETPKQKEVKKQTVTPPKTPKPSKAPKEEELAFV